MKIIKTLTLTLAAIAAVGLISTAQASSFVISTDKTTLNVPIPPLTFTGNIQNNAGTSFNPVNLTAMIDTTPGNAMLDLLGSIHANGPGTIEVCLMADGFVGRSPLSFGFVANGLSAHGITLSDTLLINGMAQQASTNTVTLAPGLSQGVSNTVTYLVHTHHHADHAGASSLFGKDVVRIGHEETRRLLLRDDDPARPAPEEIFTDRRTLKIGGEQIELAWHGPNHTPDNILIHFPEHDTLMMADIVNVGWVPVFVVNLSDDIPGYLAMPGNALTYPWTTLISGHLGRLGKREDVILHQQYMTDLEASARIALATVDPTPYFQKYGGNLWAAVKGYLIAVGDATAAPVIEKYTGVLAAADVFTPDVAFWLMESMRLNRGDGLRVHP